MQFLHHCARDSDTGSCQQLVIGDQQSSLIDCCFKARKSPPTTRAMRTAGYRQRYRQRYAVHVHIDHVGRIPQMLAAGFKEPNLCSGPSVRLLPLVLEDAFQLIRRVPQLLERYLKLIGQRIVVLPYKYWFIQRDSPHSRVRVRLPRDGHILGSAYIECEIRERSSSEQTRELFSGDLGAPYAPQLPAPTS